jgi:hypothetical protein
MTQQVPKIDACEMLDVLTRVVRTCTLAQVQSETIELSQLTDFAVNFDGSLKVEDERGQGS